jgi:hypothetical protein
MGCVTNHIIQIVDMHLKGNKYRYNFVMENCVRYVCLIIQNMICNHNLLKCMTNPCAMGFNKPWNMDQ